MGSEDLDINEIHVVGAETPGNLYVESNSEKRLLPDPFKLN